MKILTYHSENLNLSSWKSRAIIRKILRVHNKISIFYHKNLDPLSTSRNDNGEAMVRFWIKFLSENPYTVFWNFFNNMKFIILTSRQENQHKVAPRTLAKVDIQYLQHVWNHCEKMTVSTYLNRLQFFLSITWYWNGNDI